MTTIKRVQLEAPYLILIGNVSDPTYAKTGLGIVHWQPGRVAGQLRFAGCEIDLGVPDMTIDEAAALLTGVPAGDTDRSSTVHGRVADRLGEMVRILTQTI